MLLAGLGLLVPAAASAQTDEGTLRVRAVPNVADAPSRVEIEASGQRFESGGELPRSVIVDLTRGIRYDKRAVPARCTDLQAEAFACPAGSRIGGGEATGTVTGPLVPGGSQPFRADIDLFLAPARSGELAGLIVQVREQRSGLRGAARGSVRRISTRRFGSQVRFDFPARQPLPPGAALEVESLFVRVGRTRRVNGTRRTLLRNPRTCPGSWPYRIRVVFEDTTIARTGAVACRARRSPALTG